MSLTALNWKRLATVVPATGAVSDVLAAINTALTAVTYYDGSARTPGSGSAWQVVSTEGSPLEAVRASPPYASSIAQRAIFCGKSSAPPSGPTFAAGDTGWVNSILHFGLSKGSIGAATNWYSATPWTTDTFFGLWKTIPCGSVTCNGVYIFESQEAIAVFFSTTGNAVYGGIVGAFLDPEVATANAAESDGRLYGMCTNANGIVDTFNTARGTTGFLWHYTINANPHFAVFSPGAGSLRAVERGDIARYSTTVTLLTEDGDPVTWPLYAFNASTYRWTGRMREIRMCRDAKIGNVIKVAGVDKAYVMAGSPAADQDAICFVA